ILIGGLGWSATRANEARDVARSVGRDPGEAWRRVFFAKYPGRELERVTDEAGLLQANQRMARRQRETNERLRRVEQEAAAARAEAQRVRDARPVAERLEELQGLYAKGLVNEDEFAEKRREILGDV
ncbi:MAG: SHOCT domain-containing protein, partial [Ilumatobacteraceae bacterium]